MSGNNQEAYKSMFTFVCFYINLYRMIKYSVRRKFAGVDKEDRKKQQHKQSLIEYNVQLFNESIICSHFRP